MSRLPDADDRDVVLDGLALVQAAHADDWEGAEVILANCRAGAVACFLSRVCADVIEATTDDADLLLTWLRDQHGAAWATAPRYLPHPPS